MKKKLDKTFDPSVSEDRIYKKWVDNGYFEDKDRTKKTYTIIMPPPNVTGQLHMGHALDNSIQDALIRIKRMQGYNALWVPGTDHASISTEVKVVDKLAKEGLTKEEIGREEFLKRAVDWKNKYGGEIVSQLKKLGCSCNWNKERFTMDDGLKKSVFETFKKLYDKGYVYRGEKLINWCTKCKTTISDAEVDHKETSGYLYYIKYKIQNSKDYITFATTRPETILGDTAIAVNPNDDRYKDMIGKKVIVPIVNREIEIIADNYVDMKYGTGVVKVTPAHDPNDYEIGLRHDLKIINILNDDGTLNEVANEYKKMHKNEARIKIIEKLQELGLFIKKEEISHSVGVHERCLEVVEPLIKLQWFISMETLSKPAIEVYKNKELNFVPDRFGKIYLHWLESIKDWCISRQLWWGHRIPVYYCNSCNNIEVSIDYPSNCSKCRSTSFTQEDNTLDTWFSSGLWAFATLNEEDFSYYYPTNVLVTSYDIIFFWVVRMVFLSLEETNIVPFKDVFIHGLIRDEQGRKMSKSLGNGINPLDVISEYGTDALRFTLISGNSFGNDLKFSYSKVNSNRNFINKIWNATKFMLMYLEEIDTKNLYTDITNLTLSDKWIMSRINTLAKEVTHNIDNYDLGIAAQKVYDFIWNEYCDWYIEMVKPRLYNKEDSTRSIAIYTLYEVLVKSLKLLHPFMPFITEEIYTCIQDKEPTIMLSKWVEYREDLSFQKEELEISFIQEAVKNIRNVRSKMNVAPSKKIKIILVSQDENIRKIFSDSEVFFKVLASAEELVILNKNINFDEEQVSIVLENAVMYIPFADLVNVKDELNRLNIEKEKLFKEIDRIEVKLSKENFINKAPAKIVLEEKGKLEKYKNMLTLAQEQIKKLNK